MNSLRVVSFIVLHRLSFPPSYAVSQMSFGLSVLEADFAAYGSRPVAPG